MVERGDATPEDIDTAMELGAGYRECFTFFFPAKCHDAD